MARGFSSNPNKAGCSRPRTPSPSSGSSGPEIDPSVLEERKSHPGGISIGGSGVREVPVPAPLEVVPVSVAVPVADNPGGPESYPSWMSRGDLVDLRENYEIPASTQLFLPGPRDRVTSGGPGRIAFYEDFFLAGLRFPLHPFFFTFLGNYRLVPAQLTPNSFRLLFGFLVLCSFHGFVPRFSLFRAFFQLKRCHPDVGWWYLSPRPKLLKFDLPSSIKGWKNRFFFASVEGVDFVWSDPDQAANRGSRIEAEDEGAFRALLESKVPPLDKLLCEQNLFEAGLSPLRPLVEDPGPRDSLLFLSPSLLLFSFFFFFFFFFNLLLSPFTAMRFSKASLRSSALKRERDIPGPPGAELKKTRTEAEPAPVPLRPALDKGKAVIGQTSALDKGKAVSGQPSDPVQQSDSVPEVVCTGSSAGGTLEVPRPSPVVPETVAADVAGPAAKAPPAASGLSSRPQGEQVAIELVRSLVESGSAIREPRLARDLFSKVALPRDRRLRGGRSFDETLMGAFPHLFVVSTPRLLSFRSGGPASDLFSVQLGNDLLIMEENKQAARRREADKDQKLKKLEGEMNDLLAKDQGSQTRIRGLEEELKQSRVQVEERKRAYSDLRESTEKRAAEDAATISQLSQENRRLEAENHQAQSEASAAQKRHLFYVELLEKARAEAREAVPRYKASEGYAAELHDAATDSYLKGVSDCWVEAKKFLPEPEVEKLTKAVGFSADLLTKVAESEPEEDGEGTEPEPRAADQGDEATSRQASEAAPSSLPSAEQGTSQPEAAVDPEPAPEGAPPAVPGPETELPAVPGPEGPEKRT